MSYDWSKHIPRMYEAETFSGRYVDLVDPSPACIELQDVMMGLANQCRYSGQIHFFSVAEHAVMVSRRLERQGFDAWIQLKGLHHDDSEFLLGDVTRPLKGLFQPLYEELTKRMDQAIIEALKLPFESLEDPAVKQADNWSAYVEARHLLPSRGRNWGKSAVNWGLDVDKDQASEDTDLWTGGQDPWTAAQRWKAQHDMLLQQIDDIEDIQRAIREYA